MTIQAIASLRRYPVFCDSRRYLVQRFDPVSSRWQSVSYIIGTRECDAAIARKVATLGGRYRALPA